MSLEELSKRRCVLITGKGGAGKSCVAAAVARWAATSRRVLLAEVADQSAGYSPLARLFGRERLPQAPEPIAPGVSGVSLMARSGQELFLASVLHNATIARAALSSEAIRRLLNAGPSFREMGVYFHLLTLLRARQHDGSPRHELIVIDMPATGHTLSLTGLPETLLRLVPRGPIADALREGQGYLNDPAKGVAWVVTLLETLPVSECLELLEGLGRTSMPAGGVLVNRVPRDPFTPGERAALAPIVEREPLLGAEAFQRRAVSEREARRLLRGTDRCLIGLPEAESGADVVAALVAALERAEPLGAMLGLDAAEPCAQEPAAGDVRAPAVAG